MLTENRGGLTALYAGGTNKITNSQRSFFSDFIYLGINDSIDNYEEVPRNVWRNFIDDNRFIENEVDEVKANMINLEDLLIDTDFRLMLLEMEKEYEGV